MYTYDREIDNIGTRYLYPYRYVPTLILYRFIHNVKTLQYNILYTYTMILHIDSVYIFFIVLTFYWCST